MDADYSQTGAFKALQTYSYILEENCRIKMQIKILIFTQKLYIVFF